NSHAWGEWISEAEDRLPPRPDRFPKKKKFLFDKVLRASTSSEKDINGSTAAALGHQHQDDHKVDAATTTKVEPPSGGGASSSSSTAEDTKTPAPPYQEQQRHYNHFLLQEDEATTLLKNQWSQAETIRKTSICRVFPPVIDEEPRVRKDYIPLDYYFNEFFGPGTMNVGIEELQGRWGHVASSADVLHAAIFRDNIEDAG
ncbi:unnamed protein product, partial [Amoebophrya sp. A120]